MRFLLLLALAGCGRAPTGPTFCGVIHTDTLVVRDAQGKIGAIDTVRVWGCR